MGFGIRVPGVRVSTRGVRVGIGRASVGVSTRGSFSASVGGGRVSAGRSGVSGSVGVGPVRVGSRGVSVSGGVGPVFGSVSTRAVSAGVGLGPVWANGRIKTRNFNRSRTQNSGLGRLQNNERSFPARGVDISSQLDDLDKVGDLGQSRRSSEQIAIDAVNAICLLIHPLTIPFQDFGIS